MDMQFPCDSCGLIITVPEEQAGQIIKCPNPICASRVVVPVRSSKPSGAPEPAEHPKRTVRSEQSKQPEPQESVSLRCPACRHHWVKATVDTGIEAVCPECGTTIVAPKRTAAAEPVAPARTPPPAPPPFVPAPPIVKAPPPIPARPSSVPPPIPVKARGGSPAPITPQPFSLAHDPTDASVEPEYPAMPLGREEVSSATSDRLGGPALQRDRAGACAKLSGWAFLILWVTLSFGVSYLAIRAVTGHFSLWPQPGNSMQGYTYAASEGEPWKLVSSPSTSPTLWPFVLLYTLPVLLSPLLVIAMRRLSRKADAWLTHRITHSFGTSFLAHLDSLSLLFDGWHEQFRQLPLGRCLYSHSTALSRTFCAGLSRLKVSLVGEPAKRNTGRPDDPMFPSAPLSDMSVDAGLFREATRAAVRRVINIVLLLIVQWVVFSFLKENRYSSRMMTVDWIRLGFSLAFSVLGIKLYQPIKIVAIFYASAFAKSRKHMWGEANARHLLAVTTDLLMLAFVIVIYVHLLPSIDKFCKAVLHIRTLPQMLNVVLVIAGCVYLFKLWKNIRPLLALLTNRIASTFPVSTSTTQSTPVRCPSCKATNGCDALYCISCGTSLKQQTRTPAPTTVSCPACNTENPLDAKFCYRCGKALERRSV